MPNDDIAQAARIMNVCDAIIDELKTTGAG
jgi:hypothetical protein